MLDRPKLFQRGVMRVDWLVWRLVLQLVPCYEVEFLREEVFG